MESGRLKVRSEGSPEQMVAVRQPKSAPGNYECYICRMPVRRSTSPIALGDGHTLPASAAGAVVAIVGRGGSGRTETATTLGRQLLRRGVQILVLDPAGAWAPALGRRLLPLPVAGGRHGDGPFDPRQAADAIAALGDLPGAIIDLSLLSREQRGAAASAVVSALLGRGDGATAAHLVIEEAGLLPRSLGELAQAGAQRGVGVTMIAQRLQSLDTGALNQASYLLAHRLTGPHDRRALAAWLDNAGVAARRRLASLSTLRRGEVLLWRASAPDDLQQLRVRRNSAAWSGAPTPEPAAVRRWLAACAAAAGASAASPAPPNARAEDPERGAPCPGDVLPGATLAELDELIARARALRPALHGAGMLTTHAELLAHAEALRTMFRDTVRAPSGSPAGASPTDRYQRELLRALVQDPGCERARAALLAGKNWRSRAFRTALDGLLATGYVSEGPDGALRAERTPDEGGEPLPDGDALVARWIAILRHSNDGGVRRELLHALHEAHPQPLGPGTRGWDALAAATGRRELEQAIAGLRALGLASGDETTGLRLGAACGLGVPS